MQIFWGVLFTSSTSRMKASRWRIMSSIWSFAPATANEAEILRVLSPVRGKAFVGKRVLTKPAPANSDDWTHRLHAADNNPVSRDSAFQGPAMLQYLAMPMQTSYQGTMLVAGGRRIELSDWVTKKPDRNNLAGILRARSLYNGQPLWERQLPKNIEPDMPICALDGDLIYLAADDACRVLVIDAETGQGLQASIEFGRGAGLQPASNNDEQGQVENLTHELRVNWLAIENGRLYVLIGKSLETRARLGVHGTDGAIAICDSSTRFPARDSLRGISSQDVSCGDTKKRQRSTTAPSLSVTEKSISTVKARDWVVWRGMVRSRGRTMTQSGWTALHASPSHPQHQSRSGVNADCRAIWTTASHFGWTHRWDVCSTHRLESCSGKTS